MNRRKFIHAGIVGFAGFLFSANVGQTPFVEKIIPSGVFVLVSKNPNAIAPTVKWGNSLPAEWEFLGLTTQPTKLHVEDQIILVDVVYPIKTADIRQIMFIIRNQLTSRETQLVASDIKLMDKVVSEAYLEIPKRHNNRRFRALIYTGQKIKSFFSCSFLQ